VPTALTKLFEAVRSSGRTDFGQAVVPICHLADRASGATAARMQLPGRSGRQVALQVDE
jgi:hypothetical protein